MKGNSKSEVLVYDINDSGSKVEKKVLFELVEKMEFLKVIENVLYLVDFNHIIYLYDIDSGGKITELIGHESSIKNIIKNKDKIYTFDEKSNIFIWNKKFKKTQ